MQQRVPRQQIAFGPPVPELPVSYIHLELLLRVTRKD